jgi:hypothetical protein
MDGCVVHNDIGFILRMGLQVKPKDDKGRCMTPTRFEQILMPNGLTAEIYDLSRPIAADTLRVEISIRIPMTLSPDDFAEPSQYELTRTVFGDEILYEHSLLQSFVSADQKDAVFQTLLGHFKQSSLPYLSSPRFRTRFAASKHRDILQNPYKYRMRPDDGMESA